MSNELKKQIRPTGCRVLVRPMDYNPYENAATESGLVLTGGLFENPDDGNIDRKDSPIWCAEVMAIGTDCKLIRPGDHVIVVKNSLMPVPYKGELWFAVGEQNVVVVLADDLDER